MIVYVSITCPLYSAQNLCVQGRVKHMQFPSCIPKNILEVNFFCSNTATYHKRSKTQYARHSLRGKLMVRILQQLCLRVLSS